MWRLRRAKARDRRLLSPPHQTKRHLLATLPRTTSIQSAHRVSPQGGRRLQGPLLAPGLLPLAFSPLQVMLPLSLGSCCSENACHYPPRAHKLAQPQPVEPSELDTGHQPRERGRELARRLRPSFRGAPGEAAAPPRFFDPSLLPALSPPSLPGAPPPPSRGTDPAPTPGAALKMLAASPQCASRRQRGGGRSHDSPPSSVGWVEVCLSVCPAARRALPLPHSDPITPSSLPAQQNLLTFPRSHLLWLDYEPERATGRGGGDRWQRPSLCLLGPGSWVLGFEGSTLEIGSFPGTLPTEVGAVARKPCSRLRFFLLFLPPTPARIDRSIRLPSLSGKQRMHFLSKVE